MAAPWHVGILIFDGVDVLEFGGPLEVFTLANFLFKEQAPFRVFTVAERAVPVIARGQLSINPRYSFQDCPPADVLVVPGGAGIRREMENIVLLNWIQEQAQQAEIVLSVSTGAFLLSRAGVLDGLTVTTHAGAVERLRRTAPQTRVRAGARLVEDGRIVTSAGMTAGIDAALHVVGRLLGAQAAQHTAQCLEHTWAPNGNGQLTTEQV